MDMRMSQICYLLLTLAVLSANGRSRRGQMSKRVPIYRSMDVQTFEDEEDPLPKQPKLTLIKGRGNEVSEGRLFKHLLLLRQLSGTGNGGGGGGGNASGSGLVPYIFVNNPSQLTNVNTNVIPGAPPATTTTTGTGTGTGGGGDGGGAGGGDAGGGGGRIGVGYLSNSDALPYPMRLPTPIYQQRHQAFPQVIYGPPLKSVTKTVRRGNRRRNKNNVRQNPFAAFANNLKRIQFF